MLFPKVIWPFTSPPIQRHNFLGTKPQSNYIDQINSVNGILLEPDHNILQEVDMSIVIGFNE